MKSINSHFEKKGSTEICDKLKDFLLTQRDVVFAYLFGSAAQNDMGPLSDVDVAVYLKERLGSSKRFDRRLELMGKVESVLKVPDKVDLIILNDLPLLLRFNVIYKGILLLCRDHKKRILFETRTMSTFFDRQYYYERDADITIKRIAQKGIL